MTDGGSLAADYIIRAVVSSPTKPITSLGVERAIQSVLERSNDWEFRRIATPLLAGGPAGLGMDTAARILIDMIFRCRTATYPMEVCIVVGSEEEKSMVNSFLRSRQAYES